MRQWRARLSTAVLPLLFLYFAVAFGVFSLLLGTDGRRSAAGATLDGALFGLAMTTWIAFMRWRDRTAAGLRSRSDRLEIALAVTTGRPPDDVTLDATLLSIIERRSKQLRWSQRSAPLFGAIAVLSLILAVSQRRLTWFLYMLLFLGVLVWSRWSTRRSQRKLTELEASVRVRNS